MVGRALSAPGASLRATLRHVPWLALCCVISVGCGGDGGASWSNPSGFDAVLGSTLDGIAADRLRIARAPGVTLTVHIPEQGTYVTAAGFRDVAEELPMLPRTRFRIGSLTKTFHTATLLLLAEEGQIALSDPADDWVPEFGLDRAITLELLLAHRSGIFNYTDDPGFLALRSEPWTPAQIVTWSLEHAAPYTPNEAHHYSNTGFFVTGLSMEAATGRGFHELVREHVLDPLGLRDTSEERGEGRDPHMAEGYILNSEATDEIDMVWAWAAGGMVSTGVDVCRFLEATYRGDLLPPAARDAMITPSALSQSANGAENGYGLGTRHTVRGGRAVIGHTGSTMGFKGEAFIEPITGVCVAVLTNSFVSTPTEISDPAWDAVWSAL